MFKGGEYHCPKGRLWKMIWCLTLTVWSSCSQRWSCRCLKREEWKLASSCESRVYNAVFWEKRRSVFDHVPDPGAKLWNSSVDSGPIPVPTPDPPAEDPSKLPPPVLPLTRNVSATFWGWFLAECTFTTMGPPLSPSQLSCPPDVVPAHTKIFGIHSFWPEFLKTLSAVCYS